VGASTTPTSRPSPTPAPAATRPKSCAAATLEIDANDYTGPYTVCRHRLARTVPERVGRRSSKSCSQTCDGWIGNASRPPSTASTTPAETQPGSHPATSC
jgi:hypothetical protein